MSPRVFLVNMLFISSIFTSTLQKCIYILQLITILVTFVYFLRIEHCLNDVPKNSVDLIIANSTLLALEDQCFLLGFDTNLVPIVLLS